MHLGFFWFITDEKILLDFLYRFVETRVTSTVARSYCEQWGGHLVSVTTQVEANFVNSNMYVHDELYYFINVSRIAMYSLSPFGVDQAKTPRSIRRLLGRLRSY